jgi:hypothetical protein
MPCRVINIAPLFSARRIAGELLRRRGPEFFTVEEERGPSFRLDPAKLDLVVELARRDAQILDPGTPASTRDLRYCLRLLRREMVQKVISGIM